MKKLLRKTFQNIVIRFGMPILNTYYRIIKPETEGSRAIILNGNKILLVQHLHTDTWSLPGGGKNKRETPEACVYREINEELGISDLIISYKLGTYQNNRESKKDTIHIFITETEKGQTKLSWELKASEWFPVTDLPHTTGKATRRRIEEYLSGEKDIKTTWFH